MPKLTYYVEELNDLNDNIDVASAELSKLHARKRMLTDSLQDQCPHPKEMQKDTITKGDDPLEADGYHIKCIFCNKELDRGYIFQHRRVSYNA